MIGSGTQMSRRRCHLHNYTLARALITTARPLSPPYFENEIA